MDLVFIVILVIIALISAIGGFLVRKFFSEKSLHAKNEEIEKSLRDARKEAENIKREASIQARDQAYNNQQQFEREIRAKKNELDKLESRLAQKEENIGNKIDLLDKKEMDILKRERELSGKEKEIMDKEEVYKGLLEEEKRRLEEISGISSEDAKKELIRFMEEEAKLEAVKIIKSIEEEARETADKKAKEIISYAIQRYAGDYVTERTVSVVNLPNDEMKGRIIGREGRNIRAIEAATGIDLIIDDTPEAVIISSMNPVRREVAKVSLERLIVDGRIHPARIEEIVEKVEKEINNDIKEAGEQAAFDVGIHNLHPELVKLIGKLKFRTSYGQNCYVHSLEVAFLSGIMAAEIGINEKQAKRAGLLHDIGKAMDHEVEGAHAAIGVDVLRKHGESGKIISAVATHHDDKPDSVLGVIVQAADALSAARPGARREMWETYVKRIEGLEKIASSFKGVSKAYAIQAGRELRVIVEGRKINDNEIVVLSKDIAKKVEQELTYPGQIKVTVVRETRAVDYAK